ncbi:MAG TPA: hypothetical protein PLJ47_01865 [Candidatus Hydrogenedentes bacterium]|nr:hypothetical protein [Candidatus Hydrogenedentota bacterium]HRK33312.1 hypothetical protein [Candidatus Hydrogenedentota bacterium]
MAARNHVEIAHVEKEELNMDLSSILNLILGFANVDIAAEFATFADTFAYTLLIWLLALGGVI